MKTDEKPIAVVTGASSGIGEATAKALAREGWRVVLVARRAERLEALAAEIAAAGGEARAEPLDAADGPAVMAMADRVRGEWGSPSLVINNAGAGVWRFLEETSVEQIVDMMGAPYLAAANTSRAFIDDMLARREGHIIHVGSPASVIHSIVARVGVASSILTRRRKSPRFSSCFQPLPIVKWDLTSNSAA